MENFIKVLIAGLAVFAIAAFVGDIGPSGTGQDNVPLNITLFSVEKIGNVGFSSATPRDINIGSVTVGNLYAEETAYEEENATIKNGMFSKSEKSVTFGGENARKATLSFYVKETNSYGNLVVALGGITLLDKRATPGQYKFEIYDLNSTNEIYISAESSGAKFWAPTTYVLSDIKVAVDRYAERDRTVPFQVYSYEASGWSFGRVSFIPQNVSGPGNLAIEVNGKTVYNNSPALGVPFQADFTKQETRVSPGENILSFRTERDTVHGLKNAKLTIFYYGTGEATYKMQQFDVNEFWRAQLQKENAEGVISFYVKNVLLDSGLDVAVNNRTYSIAAISPASWYNVTFSEKDLTNTTRNTVKFSTHGSYDLGAMKVTIFSGTENQTGTSLTKRLFG